MQNKKISSSFEKVLFKLSEIFVKVDSEVLFDSRLKDAVQINKAVEKIDKELDTIKERSLQLNTEAEKLFKYIDSAQELLDEKKFTELAQFLNNKIVARQNMAWAKIREGVEEEAMLKKRENQLLDRKNKLKERLENTK